MKVAIVFLALLPVILCMTLEEHNTVWQQMSHEDRNAVTDAYHKLKAWFAQNGKAATAATCSVACASATVVETLGISAPICAAACGLIGLFG